ncbi:MAG TPA: hypothetical protein PLF21_05535 [Exilispira sp.]|nr:hypothetical protein [Exilispira sp.]
MKKNFIILFTFILLIIFTINTYSQSAKIIKNETIYVTLNYKGQPTKIKISYAFKWLENKIITFLNKFGLSNFKIDDGIEKLNQNSQKVEITTKDKLVYFYVEPSADSFKLPVNFNINYILNGKETSPENIINSKGNLEIRITANNNSIVREKIEYQTFPQNETISEQVDLLLPYIVLVTTEFKSTDYDEVDVPLGMKVFKGENYSITIPIFPYPTSSSSIFLSGTFSKLPTIYLNCQLVSFKLPELVGQNYDQINQMVIDNFNNYISIKNSVLTILDLEKEVVQKIKEFRSGLSKTVDTVNKAQDLLNLYIKNLEAVMKMNNLLYSILLDMKNVLGFDDTSIGYIKQFIEFNNQLIDMVLSGSEIDQYTIPGLYSFPDYIVQAEDLSRVIDSQLNIFLNGLERVEIMINTVKQVLETYESQTIDFINVMRRDYAKYTKLLNIAVNYAKDYSLILDKTNLPKDIQIEQSYSFFYVIEYFAQK